MRYQPAHAAKSGSVPFMLRGPKSVRTILSAAVAGVVGLVPAVLVSSPAMAAPTYTLTADPNPVAEGAKVTATLTFVPDQGQSAPADYTWATSDEEAKDGEDFTAPVADAPVTFTNNVATLEVQTTNNALYEGPEDFVIIVYDDQSVEVKRVKVTIDDSADQPTYSLEATPTSVSDTAADRSVTIKATLNKPSALPTKITLTSGGGTATEGQDYTTLDAVVINIPASQLTGTTTAQITKDDRTDILATESFTVDSTADNATATTSSAQINITDGDTAPVVKLTGGGAGAEGSPIEFTVQLDHGSEKDITVDWDAVAGTPAEGHGQATPGTDFPYPGTRTVTIPAKSTSTKITVTPGKDSLNELTEDFTIQLKNAVNATLGSPSSLGGAITDSDTAPKVTITPAEVTEGDTGRTTKTFVAKLDKASGRTVRVNWATDTTGSTLTHATPTKDYVVNSGTLTFPVGTTEQSFTVDIIGDKIDEGSDDTPQATDGETFKLALTPLQNDTSIDVTGGSRTVTITDDDATPTITFADKSMKEGNDASAVLFPVMLSNPSDHPLTFDITDATGANSGTAKAATTATPGGDDYDLLTATVTIAPETSTGYAVVLVKGDDTFETSQTAYFKAAADAGSDDFIGAPTTKTAKLTLENEDAQPDVEINSVTGQEGDTVPVTGTVTGLAEDSYQVSVSFAGGSSKGSKAASVDDFDNPGTKIISVPNTTLNGEIIKIADIKLNTSATAEPAETIIATGAGIGNVGTVTEGIITIAAHGAQAPEPGDVTLKSSASYRLGVGQLKLSGTATAGTTVTLWGTPIGAPEDKEWQELGTTTVNEEGGYQFFPKFTTTGWWFRVSDGENESDAIKVYLKQDPDFYVRSSSKGTATLSVFGDPRVAGLSVRLLRANRDGSWSTVGTGKLNADGKYVRTLTGLKSGSSILYKATVYGDGDVGMLTNTSKSARVTVR